MSNRAILGGEKPWGAISSSLVAIGPQDCSRRAREASRGRGCAIGDGVAIVSMASATPSTYELAAGARYAAINSSPKATSRDL